MLSVNERMGRRTRVITATTASVAIIAMLSASSAAMANVHSVSEPAKAATAPTKADKDALAPVFQVGKVDVFDFGLEQQTTISAPDGGKGSTRRLRQDGRITRRVVSVSPDGGATLSLMYERAKVEMSIGPVNAQRLAFDTAMPAAADAQNELAKPVRAAVGRPILVTVNGAGEIVQIEGNTDPEQGPDGGENANASARGLIGDDVIRTHWRPLWALDGTGAKAQVGATWTTSTTRSEHPFGRFQTECTWKVTKADKGVVTAERTGAVTLSPAVGPSAVKSTIKAQSLTGTAEWDVAAGVMRKADLKQSITLEAESPQGPRTIMTTVITSVEKTTASAVFKAGGDAMKPVPAGGPADGTGSKGSDGKP